MDYSAKSLLGFHFDAKTFSKPANTGIDDYTVRQVEKSITALKEIEERVGREKEIMPRDLEQTLEEFWSRVKEEPEKLMDYFHSRRRARRLAQSLAENYKDHPWISETRYLQHALLIITRYDSPGAMLGVFDALLQVWNYPNQAEQLRQVLGKFLSNYSGRRRSVVGIKEYAGYYTSPDGAIRWAGVLLSRREAELDPWNGLKLKPHTQKYVYFSEVLNAYFNTALQRDDYIPLVRKGLEWLTLHHRKDAYKQCLAQLIVKIADLPVNGLQDETLQLSFQGIGDPATRHNWMPWDDASARERLQLEKARETLNQWVVQRFITAFFSKVLEMDKDRKDFWMLHTKQISQIKVFSDEDTRRKLAEDERLFKYVDSVWGKLDGPPDTSALMMRLGDRIMIEFSNIGNACYAYQISDPKAPRFNTKRVHLNDLKRPRMGKLYRYSGTQIYGEKEEGSVHHKGNWQVCLKKWMRKHIKLT